MSTTPIGPDHSDHTDHRTPGLPEPVDDLDPEDAFGHVALPNGTDVEAWEDGDEDEFDV